MTTEFSDALPEVIDRVPARLALRLVGVPLRRAARYARSGPPASARRLLGRHATDSLFRLLAAEAAAARGGAATWLGRMSWRSPGFGDGLHCIDLPFFFDVLGAPTACRLVGARAPQALADDLHGAAIRLIRGEEPAWPRWTAERGETRVLDDPVRTESHGYADLLGLLRTPSGGGRAPSGGR